MSEFDLLSVASEGMGMQRALLDVAARNVAAAQASTPAHPYPRLVAQFSAEPSAADNDAAASDAEGDDDAAVPPTRFTGTSSSGENADALTEMIAVLDAQRAYEANASIFDVGKRLAERTLQIGQG